MEFELQLSLILQICNQCILKRDHHCFLTNTCIGFSNQRFFVVLSFYVTLACFGALPFGIVYLYTEYYPTAPRWDYFPPVTFCKWLYGAYPIDVVFMICHLYLLPPVGFMALGFFVLEVTLIVIGKTPYEFLKSLHLKNCNSVPGNCRSVFGGLWLVNFLLPLHLLRKFRQTDDPRTWPHMKIHYTRLLPGGEAAVGKDFVV